MGYDIPLAIGAAMAGAKRVPCVTGDGSFMLNMQELELVRRYNLPIQFFVYSNNGYGSIRAMQQARFEGNIVGADPSSGLTLPELDDIAECYGLDYLLQWDNEYLAQHWERYHLIKLHIDPDYVQYPRVATSFVDGKWQQDSMEDMTPKLPADELKEIMDYDGPDTKQRAYTVIPPVPRCAPPP